MKKVLSLLVLSMSALFIFSTGNPEKVSADRNPPKEEPVYRIYNPNSGEHLYTNIFREQNFLISIGWKDEGIAWYTPANLYRELVGRLYNPNAGDHHYTTNYDESLYLNSEGWFNDAMTFTAADKDEDENAAPVYRVYNPNAVTGSHHFTLSATERDNLIKAGWKDEGISWYSIAK